MLATLNPKTTPQAAEVLSLLVEATRRMPEATRALWVTRIGHVYGALDGQRGLELGAVISELPCLRGATTVEDLVLALHTYFVLVADLVARSSLEESPSGFLHSLGSLELSSLRTELGLISSGKSLTDQGVHGSLHAFTFDWYVEVLTLDEMESIRRLLVCDRFRHASLPDLTVAHDPLGEFYQELIPKNLLHALGEVYTPSWLAELLVEESGWKPGQTLVDPFCGSGVFLLAALRKAKASGASVSRTITSLLGIDLNPVACAAARSNLVLFLVQEGEGAWKGISLPILSADSLAPSIVLGQELVPDLFRTAASIRIDGESVSLASMKRHSPAEVAAKLAQYGVRLPNLLHLPDEHNDDSTRDSMLSTRDRRYWEQQALFMAKQSRFLLTNPPWIGWEYQSRSYRTYVQSGWEAHRLYEAKGRNLAFLKEDISTLALVAVWNRLLDDGGVSTAVIRESSMTSAMASRGLRRLSLFPDKEPIRLLHVHLLNGVRVFPFAQTETAVWRIRKGEQTDFPVPCDTWSRTAGGWQPSGASTVEEVMRNTARGRGAVAPVDSSDCQSRWMIGAVECIQAGSDLAGGDCPYKGRTGVFTGGANAVYYLEALGDWQSEPKSSFRNVIGRAKRVAEEVEAVLETDLVYEIIRGKDIRRWSIVGNGLLLCPHTAETRMDAIPPETMMKSYPQAYEYLSSMRPVLDERRGFAKWEQAFRDRAFYVAQRIGTYTFSPYKVAWKYIASDFVVAVIGPDSRGRPRLPNDKVMFVAVDGSAEAYYLAGILSSSPVRWQVVSHTSGRQISASAISPLSIPRFQAGSRLHCRISDLCRSGHELRAGSPDGSCEDLLYRIDEEVASLLDWSTDKVAVFQKELISLGLRY